MIADTRRYLNHAVECPREHQPSRIAHPLSECIAGSRDSWRYNYLDVKGCINYERQRVKRSRRLQQVTPPSESIDGSHKWDLKSGRVADPKNILM
jgi:hypothetical protein